jgi:predicted PurR-regulated permease PerM
MQAELTKIPITPRTRNILLAVVAVLIYLLFWKAPALPQLLMTGVAVALILSFPVRHLSRFIPRGIAIAIVVLALLAVLVLAVAVLVPLAVDQLVSLAGQVPGFLNSAYDWSRRIVENLAARGILDTSPEDAMRQLQDNGAERVEGLLEAVVARAFDTLSGTMAGLFSTLSVILIAAYLLADGDRFKMGAIRFLPVQYRDDALVLFADVVGALSRYLAGLLVSLTFQGIASTIALTLLGVPYAILLGLWTMLGAIIPYIGSYIGGIPATIVAFTVSPTTGILTALSYVLINFIDGNLIAPRVQGGAIRVPPLFVFLAVIAGGQIAGIWGALMAVPVLAVIRVVFDFLVDRVIVVPQSVDPVPVALVEPLQPVPTVKTIPTGGVPVTAVTVQPSERIGSA